MWFGFSRLHVGGGVPRHDLRHTKWSFNGGQTDSVLSCHGDKLSVIVTSWNETFWYWSCQPNSLTIYQQNVKERNGMENISNRGKIWWVLRLTDNSISPNLELTIFSAACTFSPKKSGPYLPSQPETWSKLFKQLNLPIHLIYPICWRLSKDRQLR